VSVHTDFLFRLLKSISASVEDLSTTLGDDRFSWLGLRILRISLIASRRFCKLLEAFESTAHFVFDSHCYRVSFRCLPCQWMRIIGSRTFCASAFLRFFDLFSIVSVSHNVPTNYPQRYPQKTILLVYL